MVKNVISHQQFQGKKYHNFQYFNTLFCVNHIVKVIFKTTFIVNLNAILHTFHEVFCAGIVFLKNVLLCVHVRKCRTLYISITKKSRMFD